MRPAPRFPVRFSRLLFLLALVLAALSLAAPRLLRAPAIAEAADPHAGHAMHGAPMTEEAMRAAVEKHFADHPPHGKISAGAPVDSFQATGTIFNRDGNVTTIVDTAHISVGETILWKWINGSHTVTSGTGSGDPEVGALFDILLTTANRRFTFQFDTPGTYRFFCQPHEFLNMRGVVVVQGVAGVEPGAIASGFVASPWPNPTRAGASVRFALPRGGRAVVEVLDATGRRVSTVHDAVLPAGTFSAAWDGRDRRGAPAPAGVYMVRLTAPGLSDTRRLVLER